MLDSKCLLMMRLYIHVNKKGKPQIHLTWNYHISMTSFIYNAIGNGNSKKASLLHQKKHAPPYSFSNFMHMGPFQTNEQGLFVSKGYFVITSDDEEIINHINNYVSEHDLKIGNTTLPVVSTSIEEVKGYDGLNTYETLSPVCVGELPWDSKDGVREWYEPTDAMFASRLKESVQSKLEHIDGLHDEFKFKIKDYNWIDKKVKRINSDIEIPATRMSMNIEMDKKTSRFIQVHGLGEKTGMGFGNIIAEQDKTQKYR